MPLFSHNVIPNVHASGAQHTNGETPAQTHTPLSMLSLLLVSTRPREWIKNAFLFAALFFSQNLLNPTLLLRTFLAFGLYCMAAGGVYLMNDIKDRHEDKKHPQKRTRPIASGALPVALAVPATVVLLL